MLESHLLGFQMLKAHQERLLAEGQQIHLARRAASGRPRRVGFATSRLGVRLEAFGRHLQGLDGCSPVAKH